MKCLDLKWLLKIIKFYLIIWLFLTVIFLVIDLIIFINSNNNYSFTMVFLIPIIIYTSVFVPIILYYYYRYRYIKNNLNKFYQTKTKLEFIETSFMYRGAIKFKCKIEVRGKIISTYTNPMFSSFGMVTFFIEEYQGKEINVLYDERKDLIYLMVVKND